MTNTFTNQFCRFAKRNTYGGALRAIGGGVFMGMLTLAGTSTAQADLSTASLSFQKEDVNENNHIESVAAGRFRSGSIDDLVYIDDDNNIQYRKSKGTRGDFDGSQQVSSNYTYQHLWSVDLNNDGLDDLVSVDSGQSIYVLLTSTDASPTPFQFPTTINMNADSSTTINDLDFADFNGDGNIDIAMISTYVYSLVSGGEQPITSFYSQGQYGIALGNGNGTFQPPTVSGTAATAHGTNIGIFTAFFDGRVAAGDFNGDGKADVAFCYHMLASLTAPSSEVWPGNGDGTLDEENHLLVKHSDCQDVSAVLPHGPYNLRSKPNNHQATLLIGKDGHTHVLSFDQSWNTSYDITMGGTPQGPMGPFTDFNSDNYADVVFLDGHSSFTMSGWDWDNHSDQDIKTKYDMHLGGDLQRGDIGDFDGDSKMDVIGTDDEHINIYYNLQ